MKQINLRIIRRVILAGISSFSGKQFTHLQRAKGHRKLNPGLVLLLTLLLLLQVKIANAQTPQSGKTFIVNHSIDTIDINPGDGICDSDSDAEGEQCTLRAAIIESNQHSGVDTIQIPAQIIQLSLAGNEEDKAQTGDLDIVEDVTIVGAGSDQTIIDGALLDRVFDIRSTGNARTSVRLSAMTIRNGQANSGKPFDSKSSCTDIPDCGGAIRVSGSLLATDVATILNGTFRGGGIAVLRNSTLEMDGGRSDENYGVEGGGIYSEGSVKLNGVILSTNDGTLGGGILVASQGTATLQQTIIEYNKASKGGGVAVIGPDSRLTMTNGEVVGNEAALDGGGIYSNAEVIVQQVHFDYNRATNQGGAVYAIDSTASLTLSTSLLDFNEATSGGAIAIDGATFSIHRSTFNRNSASDNQCGGVRLANKGNDIAKGEIINSTIVSNSGGICDFGTNTEIRHATIVDNNFGGIALLNAQPTQFIVRNSILANNITTDCRTVVRSTLLPWENSLVNAPGSCAFSGNSIRSGIDARLGALQDNGGPTPTVAPFADSPAVDIIASPSLCESIDQIGNPRPMDGNNDNKAECDMGAVEVKPQVATSSTLYLPLITKTYDGTWRQLNGEGQRISTMAFDIVPAQGVAMWVGDIRPLQEGGGIYTASLPSDCKNMAPFVRKEERFRILDLLISGETALGATFGNKAIFLDRGNNTWIETPSVINPNVYSLVKSEDGAFFAGTDNGVYKSLNGTEWSHIGGPTDINTLELQGTSLWIGTAGAGIQILDIQKNRMLPVANVGLQRKALEIWDILIAESGLYVATSDGVYRQKSDESWEASGLQGIPVNTLALVNNHQFAGTRDQGAWMRMPNQPSWMAVNGGSEWNPNMTVQKLLYQKDLCGGKLFAGTDNGVWVLDEK